MSQQSFSDMKYSLRKRTTKQEYLKQQFYQTFPNVLTPQSIRCYKEQAVNQLFHNALSLESITNFAELLTKIGLPYQAIL